MSTPIPCLFAPIVIDSTNDDLSLKQTGDASNFTNTVANATYTDHETFLDAVKTAIENANDGTNNWSGAPNNRTATWTIASTGVVTWTFGGLSNDVEWNFATSSSTRALATLMGFPTTNQTYSQSGGSATATGTSAIPSFWSPGKPARSDSKTAIEQAASVVRTVSGKQKTTIWGSLETRSVAFEFIEPARTFDGDATVGEDFETWLKTTSPRVYSSRFTYSPDYTDPTTNADEYFLRQDSVRAWTPQRRDQPPERYAWAIEMGVYVS